MEGAAGGAGALVVAAVAALVGALVGALVAAALAALGRRRPPGPEVAGLLEAQSARLDRIADAMGRQGLEERELRAGLERTRELVERVRIQAEERRGAEEAAWEVIRRMETMLLGGSTRGRAGENVLQEALSSLPPGMVMRDFAVNGKRVEFALVLPDGRRMPVDSKWAATAAVEDLEAEEDPAAREALARKVEDEVARRAREVSSYLEPSLTTPFAVACVPDAAYLACRRAHAEAFRHGVVIVAYSSALPVLLSLFALAARHGAAGDLEGCLTEVEAVLGAMEQTLENKVARAATMLQNAADEWRTHIGKARGSLARGRGATGGPPEGAENRPLALEAVE